MEDHQHDFLSQEGLQADDDARQQFNIAAKWSKFIAIVMFVFCGLILIISVFNGAKLTSTISRFDSSYGALIDLEGPLLIIVIAVIVIIIAVIYYFLYNFSQKVKAALISNSVTELNAGLKSLKTFFIITTVLSLLSLLNSLLNLFK